MKTLATVTALAMLATAPALAASDGSNASDATSEMSAADKMHDMSETIRARDILQSEVYTTNASVEEDWDLDAEVSDIDTEWTGIGEIEDLVLDAQGKLVGIVAEVGGLLDMGDKHVFLPVDDLKIVEADGTPYYVTRLTEEQLEEMPGIDEAFWN